MAGNTNYPVAFYRSPSHIGGVPVVGLGAGDTPVVGKTRPRKSPVKTGRLGVPKPGVNLSLNVGSGGAPSFNFAALRKDAWYKPTKERAIWGVGGLALGFLFGMLIFRKPPARRQLAVAAPVPPAPLVPQAPPAFSGVSPSAEFYPDGTPAGR